MTEAPSSDSAPEPVMPQPTTTQTNPSEAVRAMFRAQADGCAGLGSPLTARVLRLLAQAMQPGDAVADAVLGWTGDLSRFGDALALRLAGGLHGLVLRGADAGLSQLYARPGDHDDASATAILLASLRTHPGPLLQWLTSPPQTNEVRRSAALIAASHYLTQRFGLPLHLSELGASAGLNLLFDDYALQIGEARRGPDPAVLTLAPDWAGPLPPDAPPQIVGRAGVDLNPLDPATDRLRLLSYIWADQPDRLDRTRAALNHATTRNAPRLVAQGDAPDWLAMRLTNAPAGCLHLVYHTILRQYLPRPKQAAITALLDHAGAAARADSPLAHLAMEPDTSPDGAALVLRLWPAGETILLGRVDFHGRWIKWLTKG